VQTQRSGSDSKGKEPAMSIQTQSSSMDTVLAPLTHAVRKVEVAGAVSGLVGGLVMACVGALISISMQSDIWLTAKQIAAFVYGPAAVSVDGFVAGPVLVGSLLHMLFSMIFGATYALLMTRVLKVTTEFGAPVIGGLVYGLTLWLFAYFIALPLFNPLLLDAYAPAFIIQNIVYGTTVGIVYMVVRPETYSDSFVDSPSAKAR